MKTNLYGLTEAQFWTLVGIDCLKAAERWRDLARRTAVPVARRRALALARKKVRETVGHFDYVRSVTSPAWELQDEIEVCP